MRLVLRAVLAGDGKAIAARAAAGGCGHGVGLGRRRGVGERCRGGCVGGVT